MRLGYQATQTNVMSVVFACLTLFVHVSRATVHIHPSVLGCHLTGYSYNVTKPLQMRNGRWIGCMGLVSVQICTGRCDTSEIADHQIPYKISNHPVCRYSGYEWKTVPLTNCDSYYEHPHVEVFDATGCVCGSCSPNTMSCETLD